jgi:hypothetical protein
MSFFTYYQNNSGGGFDYDEDRGIAHYVIVEADDADEANKLAESHGLYFDGCDDGRDCDCCGDRWYRASDHNASDLPEVYGDTPEDAAAEDRWHIRGSVIVVIVYASGAQVLIRRPRDGEQPAISATGLAY